MASGGPRRLHPPPARPAVARIAPMVPEVSMLLTNVSQRTTLDGMGQTDGPADIRSESFAANTNFPFSSVENSGTMRPLDPPTPHKNPLQYSSRPTQDFSLVFDGNASSSKTSATSDVCDNLTRQRIRFRDYVEPLSLTAPSPVCEGRTNNDFANKSANKSSDEYPNIPATVPSTTHPEVLKMLIWQNEQLKRLQEQVQILLNSSPQASIPEKESPISPQATESNRRVSSVSTNTSLLWPEIQQGLQRLQADVNENETEDNNSTRISLEDLRRSNIKVNRSDVESQRSPQPTVNIDLPEYPGSECSPELCKRPNTVSWNSPVLGESVSMYEEQQNVEDVYNDILHKVRQLLAEPNNRSESQAENDTGNDETANVQDPETATLHRLRELGISFITSEDLCRKSEDTNLPKSSDCSRMFLPKAFNPSKSIWQGSPDSSLEISSLALKYLDEHQLSKLADHHRSSAKTSDQAGSRGEVDMSLATSQFLKRHGLGPDSALKKVNSAPQLDVLSPLSRAIPSEFEDLNSSSLNSVNHVLATAPVPPVTRQRAPNARRTMPNPMQERKKSDRSEGRISYHPAADDIPNRLLDITAIRQQPKLL